MSKAPPSWAFWMALSAALGGCGGTSRARSDGNDASFSTDASADEHLPIYLPDFTSIQCEPTLQSVQRDVFGKACAWDGCHGNNAAWGLWLSSPDVSRLLVGVTAASCKSWKRVVPGSPELSFLWHKLSDPTPPCGEQMPLRLGPLPDHVKACVRGWIESLATDGASPASDASPEAAPIPDASDAAGG